MLFIITFIVLALVGVWDTIYLMYQHKKSKEIAAAFICPFNQDCSLVTESKWASTLGIRNEVLGFLFYISALTGISLSLFFPAWTSLIYLLLLIAASLSFTASLFLTGLQIFVLKNYCFYCLVSAVINLLLFVNSIFLYRL